MTSHISYCCQRDNKTLAEHAGSFYSRKITPKRREILNEVGIGEGYAGVCYSRKCQNQLSGDYFRVMGDSSFC